MKRIAAVLAGMALALGSGTAATAQTRAEKGEAKLAKMLEGRVAGDPVKCISQHNMSRLEVIDETALVYDAGSTIYVARPKDPKMLDDSDILVVDRYGSQLCTNDMIRTVDRMGHFLTGIVFLEDFVPYRKPE
ncbi:hypothetical protein FHS61_001231 [Altererythrobacter atlanticus]|uniref:Uncharacterized protein n=1 Tax=Croceibacterium atlanticum TaxID=1267766 RepID=A0A0F7KWA6_9SPHN|nr:hypothetical protein [Croceibacterium atlanticum]AKH43070.1 hypothetical protein WYH_02036 [Croceibacterium atlanticum]MBB5732227.1 hypothetical protein [Croceibacterium atlanticum]